MQDARVIKSKFDALRPVMDERGRRLWAAAEAKALGWGGVTLVAGATGMSRRIIHAGIRELEGLASTPPTENARLGRVRRRGGGRKAVTQQDAELLHDLEALVSPLTRGDPQSPLRWTCKSTAQLARELQHRGHRVEARTVARLLHQLRYSLQANRKAKEEASHPDRDAQFAYINGRAQDFQERGQPVISVDTKKKELVGNFKNGGREWQPRGCPEVVLVHDFPDPALGKAIPYGVYDVGANQGWVSVGTDHDTAAFAVESVRRWWQQMGCRAYPDARELLIMADSGGSNGSRSRLWKLALQQLADETGLDIAVRHFPPGTSKWNKIEHRMFCHITQNWRGKPLVSHEVIVSLIGSTTAQTGLQIRAELDHNNYPTGIKVTDDELARVRLERAEFHGDWNYTVHPRIDPN